MERLARLTLLCLSISTCWRVSFLIEEKRWPSTPMQKVQLTQKGYIQFLRWELPVPEINQFTFCLWMKSNDLTRAHPIFSYSKNERDRLVRAWISPQGRSVHLEIGGKEVFGVVTGIRENRWYHLCQSWDNENGRYALWIDGQLWVQGRSVETTGHVIPSGGDVVLGQEYTDFDKGLEDGIEGSVLGFNLLLASAFDPLEPPLDSIHLPSDPSYAMISMLARVPPRITERRATYELGVPYLLHPAVYRRVRRRVYRQGSNWNRERIERRLSRARRPIDPWLEDIRIEMSRVRGDPLGLQLVKLSYYRCEIGRGSPFIGGPLMLISWSRSPVRVFGGATLKNVKNSCGNF